MLSPLTTLEKKVTEQEFHAWSLCFSVLTLHLIFKLKLTFLTNYNAPATVLCISHVLSH